MIYSRNPVTYKKFNFLYVYFVKYFFLDTVVKPRYDIERIFRSMQ
ncbi:MAG TPA: palindromic element RPE4 domain-containing protein [Rickettsia endosymbiont of Pyrocoelia pectoralis]|nr:palindromic element RPE4 domain-containing protein [Rickettsia endosymbiont of Pyrocoelia pectoralis]